MVQRKLYSLHAELKAIRTITVNPESRESQAVLAKVDESFFASEITRDAYKLCVRSLRKRSAVPDWEDLITSTQLEDSIRDELEQCRIKPAKGKDATMQLITRLNDYRRWRLIRNIGKHAADLLSHSDPVNLDDEYVKISNMLANAKSNKSFKVLRIGTNSNAMKMVDKLLAGEALHFLPTGFAGFDSVNKGFARGSFVLIGGPTGSGKSGLVSQLSTNFAMAGAKVGNVALEMNNQENLQRIVARAGQVDMTKLLDPLERLKKSEREEIRERWEKFDRRILRNGGQIEYYEFDEGVTIETVTATVQPFGLDALVIDYLGLLEGTTGDDQWRQLGNAARYCHIWGQANDCVTVGVAQVTEDGMLRYSKQMAEHAKYFWHWKIDEQSKATGIYEIMQGKARQASDHSFWLYFNKAQMTVTDADKSAVEELQKQKEDKKSSRNSEKKSKKWEKDSSIGWGDDDDEEPDPIPGKRAQHDVKKRAGKRRPPRNDVEL